LGIAGDRPGRAAAATQVMLAAVDHQRRIRLIVCLDAGSEPLSGTVQRDDEDPQRFQGWIELANAIACAHAKAPTGDNEASDRSS
jgi:hypothetical protein